MRIQVTNIETSDSFELSGHEAPILGLALDPKEEFIVIIVFCFNNIFQVSIKVKKTIL